MKRAHEVQQVRAAEAALMACLPTGALMQRAAAGLARTCAEVLARARGRVAGATVVLLVGSGDNGGDALWAGARLAARGARVLALPTGERQHEEGLAALLAAGGRTVSDPGVVDRADLVVDGVLGIGGRGGLREPAASYAERAAASGAVVVAVDLPSGVDADTGEVAGPAVRADLTVTFGAYKPGLLVDPAAALAGALALVDIGLGAHLPDRAPVEALQAADVAGLLPRPAAESDKYSRGVVGVVAGSDAYTGAAVLATGGALRGGAGMVRFCSAPAAAAAVRARWPEAVVSDESPAEAGRVQAWVAGPGMGTDEAAERRLADVLASDVPVLVDADGLALLGRRGHLERHPPTVLTPHAGEAARLLGVERAEVEARRLEHARRLADRFGATVLLKGSTTVVAGPDGPLRVNPTGTSWLASAGSGDVLAGLGASLLAAGLDPLDAASVAAYLHGLAARLASDGAPVIAEDLLGRLPAAWRVTAGSD